MPDSQEKSVSLREKLLLLLYPPKCAGCGAVGYEGLCPACKEHLDSVFDPKKYVTNGGNGFADAMFTLFPYQDPVVKNILFHWKREEYRDLPPIIIPYLQKILRKKFLPEKIHCVAFLPRRKWARMKTSFDQAERIASILCDLTALPFKPLLLRQGHSKAQRKTKYRKREKNVRGAFRSETALQGESVLLIDDIVTTGATAREGARILKKAGAMKVYILSLAH